MVIEKSRCGCCGEPYGEDTTDLCQAPQGPQSLRSGTRPGRLRDIWMALEEVSDLVEARRLVRVGLSIVDTDGDVLNHHFFYARAARCLYFHRDTDSLALDETINLLMHQIAIAPRAKTAFSSKYPDHPLPCHHGFLQLANIFDTQGKPGPALALCRQAYRQGWAGDWKARESWLEGKLGK